MIYKSCVLMYSSHATSADTSSYIQIIPMEMNSQSTRGPIGTEYLEGSDIPGLN